MLAVLLGAFALRLYQLTGQSLWWDEAWSLELAQKALAEHVFTISYPHPPLYRYLLHFWIAGAGSGEFSARYSSVLAGLLVLPLAYGFARRLCGPTAGLLAMLLLAISAGQWWYSQEVRMYVWLALVYTGLLWLHARLVLDPRRPPAGLWVVWAVAQSAALYLHYFAVLGLISLNLLAFAQLVLFRRERLRAWAMATGMAVLAFVPWVLLASQLLRAYAPEDASIPSLGVFLLQTWQAYLVGAPTLVAADARLLVLGYALAVTLGLVSALLLLRRHHRGAAVLCLWHGIVPLALAYILFQLRPGFAPRYVVAFSMPWFILLAGGVALLFRRAAAARPRIALAYVLAGGALCALPIVIAVLALALILTEPGYQRDNVRGLARDVAAQASADDIVLLDYPDPAFAYYYRGAAPVVTLDIGDDDRPLLDTLQAALQGGRQVFWVSWNQSDRDQRRLLPFVLAQAGALVAREERYPRLLLRRYRLERAVAAPLLTPASFDFGSVRLVGVSVPVEGRTGDGLPVALQWTAMAPTGGNLKASVRLRDAHGWIVAQADQFLASGGPGLPAARPEHTVNTAPVSGELTESAVARANRKSSQWSGGESAVNYYTLALPPGVPPVVYRLEVSVYDEAGRPLELRDALGVPSGQHALLGSVQVARGSIGPPDLAGMKSLQATLAPGLALLAAGLPDGRLQTGSALWLTFAWQALADPLPDYTIRVRLWRPDALIAETQGQPVYGRYPTSRWIAGESVVDRWLLPIPPAAQPGAAQVQVQAQDGVWTTVGEVVLDTSVHSFELPPMQYRAEARWGRTFALLGYGLESSLLRAGAPYTVTLYWRAQESGFGAPAYIVFVHLLDGSGRLIAQHDGPPAGGARPTTSWAPEEIITDRHEVTFTDPGYRGVAQLEVGLYDPANMQRLRLENGEDRLLLPVQLEVR